MSDYLFSGDNSPKRIIILRALQLGDMMTAVPAFRSLRMAAPEAVITLVGLPWARGFVDRFNYYLDDFIEFPGFPGLPEQEPDLKRIPKFLEEVQWLEADLAIQMHGAGGITNTILSLFGAHQMAGFYGSGAFIPEGGQFLRYPEDQSEVWRNLKLVEYLGYPVQGDHLEFPIMPQDWSGYGRLKTEYRLKEDQYVVIHAGARAVERRWPAERFAAVADALVKMGLQVILTGTSAERGLVQAVEAAMKTRPVNLAGKTTLGEVAALLSCARLLVCNDTGVSHIAAALLTPSVVLFSSSDPYRWAPANTSLHRRVQLANLASPETVLAEVQILLEKGPVHVQ